MRDINRITPFLEEVGQIWKEKFPDWRFGQLMYNFFTALGDPFYYEEDELLVAFKAYANKEEPRAAVEKLREEKEMQKALEMPEQDDSVWSDDVWEAMKKILEEMKKRKFGEGEN